MPYEYPRSWKTFGCLAAMVFRIVVLAETPGKVISVTAVITASVGGHKV